MLCEEKGKQINHERLCGGFVRGDKFWEGEWTLERSLSYSSLSSVTILLGNETARIFSSIFIESFFSFACFLLFWMNLRLQQKHPANSTWSFWLHLKAGRMKSGRESCSAHLSSAR